MSASDDDASSHNEHEIPKRSTKKDLQRSPKACDRCRAKKSRCDGSTKPDNKCTLCINSGSPCTWSPAVKKRIIPKAYVLNLESRLGQMEALFRKLNPDVDLSSLLEDPSLPKPESRPKRSLSVNDPPSVDLSVGSTIVEEAVSLNGQLFEVPRPSTCPDAKFRRHEFWTRRPWERTASILKPSILTFPEDDLLWALIGLYFHHHNMYLCLLHQPTFERSIREGKHIRDRSFGSLVLLVCSVGARHSNDPRVFLQDDSALPQSRGWKWFDQVQLHNSVFQPVTLHDLQCYAVYTQYVHGTSAPHSCWTICGTGIRIAIDVGAHRKSKAGPSVVTELWKRAFWVMVCMDRFISSIEGRPCTIQDEDIDVDLPIDCDDEFWEPSDPVLAFQQPPGRPSKLSAFISLIKLTSLVACTLRALYTAKTDEPGHRTFEETMVTQLDSALNSWLDSVPPHLVWDPHREDDVFFNQSAHLYLYYYHLQILIHRPFIPSPKNPRTEGSVPFPSLEICGAAAKSLGRIIDIQTKRQKMTVSFHEMPTFIAGVVLLLSIWAKRRTPGSNVAQELAVVELCLETLKECEKRWHSSGRLRDILGELSRVADHISAASEESNGKRKHDSDRDDHDVGGVKQKVARLEEDTNDNRVGPLLPTGEQFPSYPIPPHEFSHGPDVPPAGAGSDSSAFQHVSDEWGALPPAQGYSLSDLDQQLFFNDNATALWAVAPASFGPGEWNAYLDNMNEDFLGELGYQDQGPMLM